MPTLSVIIVTFNTRDMTLDCLRTLTPELTGLDAEVFVVDNASTDHTAAAIREQFPGVKVLENAHNRGFGAANNVALAQAQGRYLLLLNSDAFPKPGAIRTLLAEIERQPKTGVLGPRLLNQDGTLQLSCFRFPSPGRAWLENLWLAAAFPQSRWGDYRTWPHDQPRTVEWVVGACLLVRREVYEQVGGFDERFFMYAEESDWQLRIRQAGWDIAFTPAAQVVHLAGASGSRKSNINPAFFDSLDYYERKHHGTLGLLSLRLAMVIGCTLRFFAWLGAFLCMPAKRALAREKLRLHRWLVWRQLTTRLAAPEAQATP